jgi:hypothetical protein
MEELRQKSLFVCPDREERIREYLFTVPIHAEFGILWGVR